MSSPPPAQPPATSGAQPGRDIALTSELNYLKGIRAVSNTPKTAGASEREREQHSCCVCVQETQTELRELRLLVAELRRENRSLKDALRVANPPQIPEPQDGAGSQAPRRPSPSPSPSLTKAEPGPRAAARLPTNSPTTPVSHASDVTVSADQKNEFLDAWFPALQTESYVIPTEHFRTVQAYNKKPYGGGDYMLLKGKKEINDSYMDSKYNTAARNILALEKIIARLHKSMTVIREKSPNDVMVMMTQTNSGVYRSVYAGTADLNNNAASSNTGKKAEALKRDLAHDLADLVVVDKGRGVLMGAVVRNNGQDLRDLKRQLDGAIAYLYQAREIVNKYVLPGVEGGSEVPVHATLLLPNLTRSAFQRAVTSVKTELEACLRVEGGSDVTLHCLCRDDMDDGGRLMKWWETCRGEEVTMEKNVYRDLVYRFAVPLVTVEMFLGSEPRLALWDKGQVVHALGEEFGRGWTRLALFPEQQRVLEEHPEDEEGDDDVILLRGPPGTSKTFLLMLRASRWMKFYQPVVAITQTTKKSLAACLLIQHQLEKVAEKVGGGVKMIDMSGVWVDDEGKVRSGQEQLDAGLEELCRGAVGGAVHLLADEAEGKLVGAIYNMLKERGMVVRMWAAGVDLTIPDNLQEKVRVLRQPLRCPRAVTEEVRQSDYIGEGRRVPAYSEPEVARAHRGLPPDFIKVDRRKGLFSEEAGRAVGKHLKKLGVGVRPPGGQRPLRYRDVCVLGWSGTGYADVSRGLRAEGVPARHEPLDWRTGELTAAERDWVGGLATGGGEDAVTVTDIWTVMGLERRVVVWLDEEGSGTDGVGRLHGMSRSTAHLVIVRRK